MTEFMVGDSVIVTEGPFADFRGVIEDIDVTARTYRVAVNIFDRITPVELGYDQVRVPRMP